MQEITLQPRICECCGGSDLEFVWSGQSTVARASDTWKFPFSIAVCRICGFAFNSPAPVLDDLARYHADGLSGFKEIGLPYSVDARIAVLERFSVPDGVFAEIGGDKPDEFHRRCASLFGKQLIVEVTNDASVELRSVHDLAPNSVDVLAHYDVLEHVSEITDFLSVCQQALKPNGVMICEVPDIRLYPRNLLLQEFEHVNHFSTTTLSRLARKVGLRPIEFGHICSRPFGLLGVFRKEESNTESNCDFQSEYLDALACIRGGLEQIRRCEAQIESVRQQITALGEQQKKITIWAATDLLRSLLSGYRLPDSAVVVDSDPRRKNDLIADGIAVLQPKDTIDHIKKSELLVICAPRYRSEILAWIIELTGKAFASNSLAVIGAGVSGETLR